MEIVTLHHTVTLDRILRFQRYGSLGDLCNGEVFIYIYTVCGHLLFIGHLSPCEYHQIIYHTLFFCLFEVHALCLSCLCD